VTCLFCGTLSACGGGLLADIFGFFRKENPFCLAETPDLFRLGASPALRKSFLCASLYASPIYFSITSIRIEYLILLNSSIRYYLLLNPSGYLPWHDFSLSRQSGHLIIGLIQVLDFIIVEIFGISLFKLVSAWIKSLLNISPVVSSLPPVEDKVASESVLGQVQLSPELEKVVDVDISGSLCSIDAAPQVVEEEVKNREIKEPPFLMFLASFALYHFCSAPQVKD
jgi:hypothetical protein